MATRATPPVTEPSDWQSVASKEPSDWQTVDHSAQSKSDDSWSNAVAEFGRKVNPIPMIQGMGDMIMHPIDAAHAYGQQNEAIYNRAKESFGKGNYTEAAAHTLNYLLNGIPGVGAALDEAGEKMANGKVKEGMADTLALATQLYAGAKAPAMIKAAPEALQSAQKVGSAVAAGAKAAAPDIASGAAKVAAGEAVRHVPAVGHIGYYPIYQGLKQTAKGLRLGNQAFREVMAGSGDKAAAAAAAEHAAMLEDISQSLAGKSYAAMTPEQQATVQGLAAKIRGDAPPATEATPPVAEPNRTPDEILGPSAATGTSKTVQDILREEMAAKQAATIPEPVRTPGASIPPPTVATGVNTPVRPPLAQPQPVAAPVAGPLAPEPPAAPVKAMTAPSSPQEPTASSAKMSPDDISRQLAEEMVRSGTASPEAVTPQGGVQFKPESTHPPAEVFSKSERPFKSGNLAQALNHAGVSAADAKLIEPGQWKDLTKSLGINQTGDISAETIKQTIDTLARLQGKPSTPVAVESTKVVTPEPQSKPSPKGTGGRVSDMMKGK